MKIVLMGFAQAFEDRFAPVAAAQEILLVVLTTERELAGSVDKEAELVLLALQPGVDRFKRLRELKERGKLPVIVLTDRYDHVDSVVALELGADDYLPKDCEPRELIACIRAVLRSHRPSGSQMPPKRLEIDGLALDFGSREAYMDGARITLTTSEFEILHILMGAAGRTVPRDELGSRLVKSEHGHLERALDVHISHLRHKLGERRHRIKTIRGIGYQFLAPSRFEGIEQGENATG